MIKKLRIRITAVIMAGLTLLIAAVVVGIYIFMQHSETEETEKSVDSALTAVTREDSDKSRTSSTGGFGLGLSIAKAIADKHRGTLTAASTPDGLTTFTFAWLD